MWLKDQKINRRVIIAFKMDTRPADLQANLQLRDQILIVYFTPFSFTLDKLYGCREARGNSAEQPLFILVGFETYHVIEFIWPHLNSIDCSLSRTLDLCMGTSQMSVGLFESRWEVKHWYLPSRAWGTRETRNIFIKVERALTERINVQKLTWKKKQRSLTVSPN